MRGFFRRLFVSLVIFTGASAASANTSVNILHPFTGTPDGQKPGGKLVNISGTVYGTTLFGGQHNHGMIYKIDTVTHVLLPVYSFTGFSDGGNPSTGLIKVGNALYGTTNIGGSGGDGVIFKLKLSNSQESVVYNFPASQNGLVPSALVHVGTLLYGTTYCTPGMVATCDGSIYSFDPSTLAVTPMYTFTNQDRPVSELVAYGGLLYGATATGGTNALGSVYSIDPTNNVLLTIHSFSGGADGASPEGGLAVSGNYLYGDTFYGGSSNVGVFYRIDPLASSEFVLASLGGYAADPEGPLTKSGAFFYSLATIGGTNGVGGIFKLKIANGHQTNLYLLDGAVEGIPAQNNLLKIGTKFYGTAWNGTGSAANGAFLEIVP